METKQGGFHINWLASFSVSVSPPAVAPENRVREVLEEQAIKPVVQAIKPVVQAKRALRGLAAAELPAPLLWVAALRVEP